MLRVVAPNQDETPARIHRGDLDDRESPLGAAAFRPKRRRDPDRSYSEAVHDECQQSDEAKDKEQRQKKSDVFKIHDSTYSPIRRKPSCEKAAPPQTKSSYVADRPVAAARCSGSALA